MQGDFPDLVLKEAAVNEIAYQLGRNRFTLNAVFDTFPSMEQVEMVMVEEALKATGGKKGAAADLLGVRRQTVQKKVVEMERLLPNA